ncbi:hypothetical protein DOTSEDRAFT_72926 [Dothistroma septosporum NZE10]|uniref:Uncharacterized protein n=1 Tax=Dothistroma septosporum (strain NZE10 / CBS 128990) TaxID=675120 RepID=N1PH79_DOTSN|nr:hypothetical protein DOTSEDRAFT_72926 [Dothistroma septosporum NZE10]
MMVLWIKYHEPLPMSFQNDHSLACLSTWSAFAVRILTSPDTDNHPAQGSTASTI